MADNVKKENKIKVSFCIPVYENSDIALKVIKPMLESKDQNFQIAVSDDSRDDTTYEALSALNDGRMKIEQHKEITSTNLNWLSSIMIGDGEWLYLVMSRDFIDIKRLPFLYKALDSCKSGVNVLVDRNSNDLIDYFEDFEAVRYAMNEYHPTGIIVRRSAFREIKGWKSFFSLDTCNPDRFLLTLLLGKDNPKIGAIGSKCYLGENVVKRYNYISRYQNKDKTQYWMAEGFTKTFIFNMKHVLSEKLINLTEEERKSLFTEHLKEVTSYLTYSLPYTWGNYLWCRHYAVDTKVVYEEEVCKDLDSCEKMILDAFKDDAFILSETKKAFEDARAGTDNIVRELSYKRIIIAECFQMMLHIAENDFRTSFFQDKGIKTIAIYGIQDLGKELYRFLRKFNVIENIYGLDRNANLIYSIMPVYTLDKKDLPKPDLVVITTAMHEDAIAADVENILHVKTMRANDFLAAL